MPPFTPVNPQWRTQKSDCRRRYWFGPDTSSDHDQTAPSLSEEADDCLVSELINQATKTTNKANLVKLLRILNERLYEVEKIYSSKIWSSSKGQEPDIPSAGKQHGRSEELYKRLTRGPTFGNSTLKERHKEWHKGRRDSGIYLSENENQNASPVTSSASSKITLTSAVIPYKWKPHKFPRGAPSEGDQGNISHDEKDMELDPSRKTRALQLSKRTSGNHHDALKAIQDIPPISPTSDTNTQSDSISYDSSHPGTTPPSQSVPSRERTPLWSSSSDSSACSSPTKQPHCSSSIPLTDAKGEVGEDENDKSYDSDTIVVNIDHLPARRKPAESQRAPRPRSKTVKASSASTQLQHGHTATTQDQDPQNYNTDSSSVIEHSEKQKHPTHQTKIRIQSKPQPQSRPPTFLNTAIQRTAMRVARPKPTSKPKPQPQPQSSIWNAIGTKGEIEYMGQTRVIGDLMWGRFSGCD